MHKKINFFFFHIAAKIISVEVVKKTNGEFIQEDNSYDHFMIILFIQHQIYHRFKPIVFPAPKVDPRFH